MTVPAGPGESATVSAVRIQVKAPFETHLQTAAHNLRSVLAESLVAVGADVTQPRAIAKRFGLDKTLAWKLSRIVGSENPAEMVDFLPGRAGFDIVVRSLEDAGIAKYASSSLRHAIAEFDRMVDVHCGDRDTLDLMLSPLQSNLAAREEAHRKRAFQGLRAVWGVQARLQVCAQFIAPNADEPDMLDVATISGLVDLRRLRPDTVCTIARFRQFTDDGQSLPDRSMEPIEPHEGEHKGLPVMPSFSSNPLPPMKASPAPQGAVRYELLEGPVGNTAAVTCLVGWLARRRFKMLADRHNEFGEHLVSVNIPTESLLFDFFVHRSLTHALSPEVAVYSQLPTDPVYPEGGRERGRLQMSTPIIDLGGPPTGVIAPEMSNYPSLLGAAFTRMGRDAAEFHGFRLRLRYPAMPTLVLYRYPLPLVTPAD